MPVGPRHRARHRSHLRGRRSHRATRRSAPRALEQGQEPHVPLRPGHLLRDLVLEFYLSIYLYLYLSIYLSYLIGQDAKKRTRARERWDLAHALVL